MLSQPSEQVHRQALQVRALEFVLRYQVVVHQGTGQRFWVTEGAGVGLKFAGSLADIAFASAVEQLLPVQAKLRDIALYVRFRDDILVIHNTYTTARHLTDWLISQSAPMFSVECESWSLVAVAMLDLLAYKQKHRIVRRPFVKPTARHVPLHPSSTHPRGVHGGWQGSEIRSMYEQSMAMQHYEHFRKLTLDSFRFFFTPEPCFKRSLKRPPPFRATAPTAKAEQTVIRMVTKYRPYLATGLQLTLDTLLRHALVSSCYELRIEAAAGHLKVLLSSRWPKLDAGNSAGGELWRQVT